MWKKEQLFIKIQKCKQESVNKECERKNDCLPKSKVWTIVHTPILLTKPKWKLFFQFFFSLHFEIYFLILLVEQQLFSKISSQARKRRRWCEKNVMVFSRLKKESIRHDHWKDIKENYQSFPTIIIKDLALRLCQPNNKPTNHLTI